MPESFPPLSNPVGMRRADSLLRRAVGAKPVLIVRTLMWMKPSTEFGLSTVADGHGTSAFEVVAAGDVDVAVKIRRQVSVSVANHGNFLFAEGIIEEAKLKENIQGRNGLFAPTDLCERLRRDNEDSVVYLRANSGKFFQECSTGNELLPPGKNVTSGTEQPFMKALAWDFAAAEEPTNILVICRFTVFPSTG